MCDEMKRISAEYHRFHATGEIPPAWGPTRWVDDEEFDREVDEINRELELETELVESGSAEPPRFGWITNIRVSR